jgi:hypothetical protein
MRGQKKGTIEENQVYESFSETSVACSIECGRESKITEQFSTSYSNFLSFWLARVARYRIWLRE